MSQARIDIPYSEERLLRVIRIVNDDRPDLVSDAELRGLYRGLFQRPEYVIREENIRTTIAKNNGRLTVSFTGSQHQADALKRYAWQILRG